MKNLLLCLQVCLFLLLSFFLYLTILDLTNNGQFFSKFNHEQYKYDGKEEYDQSLSRLNSIASVQSYCDSIFESRFGTKNIEGNEGQFTEIASNTVREKFYHGYSSYGYGNNYAALLLEPFTGFWASAIVIPDDIVKYPFAACSQQSIVLMELLKAKGITTRKVGFQSKKWGGHFCVETYYDGSWHFYDPNREPDVNILSKIGRPDIKTLASDDKLLVSLYKNMPSDQVLSTYKNYFYGKPNTFEAPKARAYQVITKVLSYIMWLFPLAVLLLVYRKYLRLSTSTHVWNSRVYLPKFSEKGSSEYLENSGA